MASSSLQALIGLREPLKDPSMATLTASATIILSMTLLSLIKASDSVLALDN